MNQIDVSKITKHWTDEILDGAEKVSSKRLQTIKMPEQLLARISEKVEGILKDEIQKICDNPFFDFTPEEAEDFDIKAELNRLFSARLVIPAESLTEIVDDVFDEMVEDWQTEPISLRNISEDLEDFADEIFKRATSIIPISVEDGGFKPEAIAEICELIGLNTLAQAIKVEIELGISRLDLDEFILITRRFMMLIKHYRVERKLISFEGKGKTLYAKPTPPEPEVAEEIPAREAVVEEPVAEEVEAPPEGLDLSDFEKDVKAAAKAVKETIEAKKKPKAEPAARKAELQVESAAPQVSLYERFMEKDNLDYFVGRIFERDLESYKSMVNNVCQQKDLNRALIIADNELFLLDIPPSAEQASRLLNVIRENFSN